MSRTQTIIFGLDGADFDMIDPWIQAGALPTLQDLIERGGRTKLKSCVPATTPPAWTSLTTGMNPGKHGIFGFYKRQKGTYDVEPVSDGDVHARRLWDYTSTAGVTSLVINVPVTHPGRKLNGAIIPGYLARDKPRTYPSDLLSEIEMSDYSIYAESETADVPERQLLNEWLTLTRSRRNLTLRVMDRYNWDLLFLEFQKTDGAVHKFQNDENIRRVFECVDACLADILAAVGNEPNVFVVSDHGIGENKNWSVALNTHLVKKGFAESIVGEPKNTSWRDKSPSNDSDNSPTGTLRQIPRALGALGITKQRIERILSNLGLYNLITRFAPDGLGDELEQEIVSRERSQAFYEGIGFSGVDVGVILNDERFYPEGSVSGEEYESIRKDLIAELQAIEGPAGAPFSAAKPREQIYSGPCTKYAPDIILKQSPQYVIGSQHPRAKTFIPAEDGRIDHKREGILIAAGPDIICDWSVDRIPPVVDITPSILHLLHIDLNDRFDGQVLQSVLKSNHDPATTSYDPYVPSGHKELTDKERSDLRTRLEGMGYLE